MRSQLIARIAEGDRKAFEELYNLYHRRMARFLTRLTRRYDVAEEVINDTFWVVWRKAGDFRGDSQPSTWILGIAYRKARSAFRASARLAERNLDERRPSHSRPRHPPTPRNCATGSARRSAQLPVEQRMAVELCYELGYSCEEIGAIMECPANTVKTRLFHARGETAEAAAAAGQPSPRAGSGTRGPHLMMTAEPKRARGMLAAAAVARQRPPGRCASAPLVEEHLRGCSACARRSCSASSCMCAALTEPERVTYAPGPSLAQADGAHRRARTGAARAASAPRRGAARRMPPMLAADLAPAGTGLGGNVRVRTAGLGMLDAHRLPLVTACVRRPTQRRTPSRRTCCTSPSSAR